MSDQQPAVIPTVNVLVESESSESLDSVSPWPFREHIDSLIDPDVVDKEVMNVRRLSRSSVSAASWLTPATTGASKSLRVATTSWMRTRHAAAQIDYNTGSVTITDEQAVQEGHTPIAGSTKTKDCTWAMTAVVDMARAAVKQLARESGFC